MERFAALTTVAIVASVLGTGCGVLPIDTTATCVDWVWFPTPQEQFDRAALVLIATPSGRDGESTAYGYKAQTHLVDVEQVLKGDPGTGSLHISSMPQTCAADSYPDGDPLDTSRRVVIFATDQGGQWFTMTPAQGVLVFDQGTVLPFNVPG